MLSIELPLEHCRISRANVSEIANLVNVSGNEKWSPEQIEQLDKLLTKLGKSLRPTHQQDDNTTFIAILNRSIISMQSSPPSPPPPIGKRDSVRMSTGRSLSIDGGMNQQNSQTNAPDDSHRLTITDLSNETHRQNIHNDDSQYDVAHEDGIGDGDGDGDGSFVLPVEEAAKRHPESQGIGVSQTHTNDVYKVPKPPKAATASSPEQGKQPLLTLINLFELQSQLESITQREKREQTDTSRVSDFFHEFISHLAPPISDPTINYFRLETPASLWQKIMDAPLYSSETWKVSWWSGLWSFLGIFLSIAVLGILHVYVFLDLYGYPFLYASHGALVTLIFISPDSTPTQPGHILGGTVICSVIGVALQKAFSGHTHLIWLASALSSSVSITICAYLGVPHPPGGALSVLYIVLDQLHVLGWLYVPLSLLGSMIVLLIALIVNNIPKISSHKYPRRWM